MEQAGTVAAATATPKVLVVEDDLNWQSLIAESLGSTYTIVFSSNLKDAKARFESSFYDAVLLDISLEDGEGFDFCTFARNQSNHANVPIIILSSHSNLESKITGYSLGADDYVQKPFDQVELRLKVKAALRRLSKTQDMAGNALESSLVFKRGNLIFNLDKQKICWDTQESTKNSAGPEDRNVLDLTNKEFKLLLFLAKNEARVFSRQQIMDAIYQDWVHVCDRNIDALISRIRKKLGIHQSYIRSVYGLGYSFDLNYS